MNRKLLTYLTGIALLGGMLTLSAQSQLESGFKNPPSEAKVRTWWHWIDGNISKQGITADLEAMKRVGIQEAQIFNVGQGYPEGPAAFMTPQWLEMFRFAVTEATRIGVEIAFHNGAGWSSSGGPWITPQYAMQTVVYSQTQIKGKKQIKMRLPQPETKLGYYQDIAVVAFPTPKGTQRIDGLELKSLSGHSFKTLLPDTKPIDPASVIDPGSILDLSNKMASDGTLSWDVPEGEWTVLRMGHTPHGTQNRPAGAGGLGLECDKLSRKAMDAYWAGGIQPILDKLGPLAGTSLNNCLIDSYEVGCNNWTTGFDKQFAQRRGYNCMAFLPTLAGYYIQNGEVTERFLWDFRKTIGDMIADNYYGYFAELCHKQGLKFSVEPYGGPFDCMQVGATGDVVMSEFWVGANVFMGSHKMVASVAHLEGNTFVGAESFTSMGGWRNHPAAIKQIGDWIWCQGVNRLIFHTYVHQPWEVAPGLTFHMYGLELGRFNTWWEPGRAYMDYLARAQFMLQSGRSATDVLVFTGETSPNEAFVRNDLKNAGYDYDLIGANKMGSLTVEDGWIYTPAGGRYRLLILPESAWMTPQLLAKIDELVQAGAVVVGPKPEKSPSLQSFPACDAQVAQLSADLWGKTGSNQKVITDKSPLEVLAELRLAPDFSGGTTGSDLSFIHRKTSDSEIYFVANPKKESRSEVCSFRVAGKRPSLWNPETGEIKEAVVWSEQPDGTIRVPIRFEEHESLFVVFEPDKSSTENQLIEANVTLNNRPVKPLSDLKILKAEYGTFLPDGMVDVTDAVTRLIENGKLEVNADNSLCASDPAGGVIKELRIAYQIDGKAQIATALENNLLRIEANPSESLHIERAIYGSFAQTPTGIPTVYPTRDVTQNIASMVASGKVVIPVDDELLNDGTTDNSPHKELRISYSSEDETHQAILKEGATLNLAMNTPDPRLEVKDGVVSWITPYSGKVSYTTASGKSKSVEVKSVPKPIELTGAWEVSFPPKLGAPEKATFDQLTSWTRSDVEGIRYFSGTATYKKSFSVEKALLGSEYSLELDLGSVKVMAEVIVNGKNLGVLWKAPFRINLDEAVRAGKNELEVRITNLWPNRLIGDEQLSDDCPRGEWLPSSWPEWLTEQTQRPSDRITFTTWKHWHKDSPLQVSGLLGPVVIRPYVQIEVLK